MKNNMQMEMTMVPKIAVIITITRTFFLTAFCDGSIRMKRLDPPVYNFCKSIKVLDHVIQPILASYA